MLSFEQHGRETTGGCGQARNLFQMRRRIIGVMPFQHYYWEDKFHDEIYFKWKVQTQVTIYGHISQMEGQSAAGSRTSAPPGKAMHKHGARPRTFLNIEYKMMVDDGLEDPPPFTALVRKTHMRNDGSFIDQCAEELVLAVEQAVEQMTQDGSPLGDSQTDSTTGTPNSMCYLLNQEYIKRVQTRKGNIYGFGNVQYKHPNPSVHFPLTLKRNMDMEMRVCGLEKSATETNEEINALKADFKEEMKTQMTTLNMILHYSKVKVSSLKLSFLQPLPQLHPSHPQAPV